MRHESEVFADHERVDNRDTDDELKRLRDTLSEDSDGIIHLSIPAYVYDSATNPFVGVGPSVRRTYAVSRYLDVVFLHRFMYQDILVCGIRSGEVVPMTKRAAFVRHIRDTGGLAIDGAETAEYDILAMKFAPYVASDTTAAWMRLFHTTEPHAADRPHWPVDIWMIFDANAYEEVAGATDFRRAFRLKPGFDRRASLLGVAQIN